MWSCHVYHSPVLTHVIFNNHLHRYPSTCTSIPSFAHMSLHLHRYPFICTDIPSFAQISLYLYRYPLICTNIRLFVQISLHLHRYPFIWPNTVGYITALDQRGIQWSCNLAQYSLHYFENFFSYSLIDFTGKLRLCNAS